MIEVGTYHFRVIFIGEVTKWRQVPRTIFQLSNIRTNFEWSKVTIHTEYLENKRNLKQLVAQREHTNEIQINLRFTMVLDKYS